jgi:L-fuconolactonase
MKVDSHQHFWRLARGDYGWLTPALGEIHRDFEETDLAPILERHGIAGTILVQAAPSEAEIDYMLALAARAPFVRGIVGWIDLERQDALKRITALAKNPLLKGVRPMIHDIADARWMLGERLMPALRHVTNVGLRFDALVRPVHLPFLIEFVARNYELPVVIDHAAKPDIARWRPGDAAFAQWRANLGRLAAMGCYCKLSGLATEAAGGWLPDHLRPYVDTLVELFGAGRLMWGSDWPVVGLAGGYDRWREATLELIADFDPATQASILGGAAAEFYGLGED